MEDRLPVVHRTLKLPGKLWDSVKLQDEPARVTIDKALDAELYGLIDKLKALGFTNEKQDKLVRTPIDENIIARLNYGRRQTGIPAVMLLRICLNNYTTKCKSL